MLHSNAPHSFQCDLGFVFAFSKGQKCMCPQSAWDSDLFWRRTVVGASFTSRVWWSRFVAFIPYVKSKLSFYNTYIFFCICAVMQFINLMWTICFFLCFAFRGPFWHLGPKFSTWHVFSVTRSCNCHIALVLQMNILLHQTKAYT